MTRDGLVEKDLATGDESRISRRGQDFDLRKEQPAHGATDSVRQAISESRSRRPAQYTQGTPEQTMREPLASDGHSHTAQGAGRDTQNRAAYRYNAEEHKRTQEAASGYDQPDTAQTTDSPTPKDPPAETEQTEAPEDHHAPPRNRTGTRSKRPLTERAGRLRFDDTHGEFSGSKPSQHGTKYQRRFAEDSGAGKTDTAPDTEGTAEAAQHPKPEKLRFFGEETPPGDPSPCKKLKKAQYQAEHSAAKLESAKRKLPKKHSMKVERNFDAETGKPKRRLRFEEEVKTKAEHLKGPIPLRSVKAGANAAAGFAHKKVRQVEQENVGVEAAHKGELLAEGAMRRAYRFHRLKPYRRVAKLERKTVKANVKYAYQKALRDNPRLQSSLLSRMAQKRKIQRQYAKAAREAKRARETARKAGSFTAKAAKAVAGFIGRHPVVVGAAALVLVVIFFFSSLFTSCSSMGGGGFTQVIMSSYTSEDEDIVAADEAYTLLEAELQERINNIESEFPGYDEYRYDLAQIGHDPFELASYLTALYVYYTPEEVAVELQAIFGQQYTLTTTRVVEVRYRTETRTDSEGNSYTVRVPYNWYILYVTLENRAVSGVAAVNLDAGQMEMYVLYMETKGNKPYLFEGNIYVDRGDPGGGYSIPPEALSDERFAVMIAEAEKYLGYPYVWGGSSPSTSFDCSGYVSWVINQTGIASVGRLGAQGLYNYCTPVSPSEAKPGDLIFFKGTYDTPGVSHVGIYVGGGMMLHCGSPIQYTSIETNYWQSHFYSYGRLP